MKFNKLYLHGFKSFVDKTTVDFPDGITAIVGPNGSGKSNIMDAVRWVFGEQNAKELRGADMEDVVFNGSQKRKPAGFAEVGLTLSDISEDIASKYGTFSEINITRKFYKTGEREYYINNRKCRLKDIKDIFMDTGLGARSISIIEQGKVDKIVNATPEELRFFLEETAGVTKFKDRKKEAEHRLAQTRDNLDRVNDIINEILGRLDSLRAQVDTLKKSEELQSNKRNLEKKYLSSVYLNKNNERKSLEDKHTQLKSAYEEALALYSGAVKSETVASSEYAELQKTIADIHEQRLSSSNEVTKTEGDIAALESLMAGAATQKMQIESDINTNIDLLDKLKDNKDILSDKKEAEESANEVLGDKVSALESALEDIKRQKDETESDYDDINTACLEYTAELTSKRNALIRRETDEEHLLSSIARLKNDKNEIETSTRNATAKCDKLENEAADAAVTLKSAEDTLSAVQKGSLELTQKMESLRIKRSEYAATLKSLDESAEFFDRQINDALTGSAEDAELLKKFSPELFVDKSGELPKSKFIEISDVLVFKDSLRKEVMEAVSEMKSSVRFSFESDFDAIAASLDEITPDKINDNIYFHNGIYRKIGADDKGLKILSLKEKLAADKIRREETKNTLESLEQEIFTLVSLKENKDNQMKTSEEQLTHARAHFGEVSAALSAAKSDLERGDKRAKTIDREIEIASSSFDDFKAETVALKAEVTRVGALQLKTDQKRSDLEEKIDIISDKLDEKKDEVQEARVELSASNERLGAVKREVDANRRELDAAEANIKKLRERLNKLVNIEANEWKSKADKQREHLVELRKNLLTIEESFKLTSDEIENIKSKIESIRAEAEKRNDTVVSIDNELRTVEVTGASVSSYVESLSAQYMEKFGEAIESNYELYADKDFQPKKTKDEIASLESQIDALGAINLNAVNDFNESETRYDFLSKQRQDLEGSIADINSFIYETDEATARMFQDTFSSVQGKFLEVFRILFGNGEAELKLSDPENPLTTGVEIYIQPPGKRLQHMGLLSGGEKALTAMTLLFALFLQKPTPFCFLDEVDAPLDDANVARYIGMVKALSDKTQFILITHNHNTMSAADSLYGVTMQEYGVSSILSVKLEQIAQAGR